MKHIAACTAVLLSCVIFSAPTFAFQSLDAGGERVINVLDGQQPFDAVNVYQLQTLERATQLQTLKVSREAKAYTDAGLQSVSNAARVYTDTEVQAAARQSNIYTDTQVQSARNYSDAGDERTLSSANSYTDQRINAVVLDFSNVRAEMNDRFVQQDERISRNGAISAAMMQMAGNSAYAKPGRGRLAVGMGFQDGESALSVGYGRRIGDNVSFSLGGAFSSDERSAGVGFGVDL